MDNVLGLAFTALAALFTVWNISLVLRLLTFRRVRAGAELTWLPPRPWFYTMCLGIGFFMTSLTFVSVFVLERPLLSVVAQALMALYYAVLFPLSFRIRRGFYAAGVWTDSGFVPYSKVRALNWRERPHVRLLVTSEPGLLRPGYAGLTVPGDRYGEARRVLASHIADRSLTVKKSVLGLSDVDAPAQEQV